MTTTVTSSQASIKEIADRLIEHQREQRAKTAAMVAALQKVGTK